MTPVTPGAGAAAPGGPTSSRMTTPRVEAIALRLPDWMGSIRFRLTAMYSLVLFSLAATLVGGIYLALAARLDDDSMARKSTPAVIDQVLPNGQVVRQRVEVTELESFEEGVNRRVLQLLRTYSFSALGVLFISSLGVGWLIAGRVLAPIDRINAVARDIQATDLSRRIDLRGPPDELKDLADTFDDMLGRLDDAFSQQQRFIQEASHELRNPLAVIRTNLDVALADPDASTEELRQAAEVVNRSVTRMGVLVDDLLTYAREGAPTRTRARVALDGVVDDTAAEFATTASARGLDLEVETPAAGVPEAAVVRADRVAVRQAVANLVANAVRLAPEGTTVRLALGVTGAWAWIAVDDGGPGIPAEDRERVFERFWRGDGARARAEGRSGLGLAIVGEIAQAHGGEVRLADNRRGGSTFTLWLPSAPAEERDGGPAEDSIPVP
ncbi:MAG: sensor histidine kinase [Iamia sp.]